MDNIKASLNYKNIVNYARFMQYMIINNIFESIRLILRATGFYSFSFFFCCKEQMTWFYILFLQHTFVLYTKIPLKTS